MHVLAYRTLVRGPWAGGRGCLPAAAWCAIRGPWAALPGARALVPGPLPRVETRHPIDRMPWPFFRFSRFWARVRSAEALARFRT